jgi:hypothetical protein
MKKILLLLAALFLASTAFSQIAAVGATGTGTFTNSPSLLIDGVIPPETTIWTAPSNVFWQGTLPAFTIDLGADFKVTGVLWSVDNNDSYTLQTSTDNVTFTTLFTVQIADGNIQPSPGGMDTMTSFAGSDFVANMAFSPVDARYLRVSAVDGDGLYSIGEVQAFGNPVVVSGAVPEPSTYGIMGVIALAGVALLRRRKTRA